MSLMDNLIAIENCKNDIKSALINKGVDMTDVAFSGYAEKINALQLESGDAPAPTPSADYIYSNGNLCDEDGNLLVEESDIINFTPYGNLTQRSFSSSSLSSCVIIQSSYILTSYPLYVLFYFQKFKYFIKYRFITLIFLIMLSYRNIFMIYNRCFTTIHHK